MWGVKCREEDVLSKISEKYSLESQAKESTWSKYHTHTHIQTHAHTHALTHGSRVHLFVCAQKKKTHMSSVRQSTPSVYQP